MAAAIVDDEERVLVIRRADNGRWEPPGGVLELHESIHDGLVREVAEETGLLVEPVALTGVYKNIQRGIIALVFRCQVVGEARATAGEVDDIRWLTRPELARMSEAYRVRLLDALDFDTPQVRAHDGTQLIAQQS